LITGVLAFLYTRNIDSPQKSEVIYQLQQTTLDQIASNPQLRQDVLSNDLSRISSFVQERMPMGFNYTVRICELSDICNICRPNEPCNQSFYNSEIYTTERAISSTITEYNPKKIKLFMWRE
jgi:hypothetical protein